MSAPTLAELVDRLDQCDAERRRCADPHDMHLLADLDYLRRLLCAALDQLVLSEQETT